MEVLIHTNNFHFRSINPVKVKQHDIKEVMSPDQESV